MNIQELLSLILSTDAELEEAISEITTNPQSLDFMGDSQIEELYTTLSVRLRRVKKNDKKPGIKRAGIFALVTIQNRHSAKSPYNASIAEALIKQSHILKNT